MTIKRRLGVTAMVPLLASTFLSGAAVAQSNEWPPVFQPLPEHFGYTEPQDSLGTFHLPPGYNIDLVAHEPLLGDGIVMQWDYEGRLWVVETTFMVNLDDLTSAAPESSIVILEDTDGDGVVDERKVFADGLVLPRSLLILEPGKVIIGEAPNIWLLEDTDGDDVADTKVALTDGNYGGRGGSIEHNPNGMFWNIDNRIYNAYLDEVYQWNGEGFDVSRGISISQWGITADDQGRLYRQGNSAATSMSYVPDHYYGRSSVFTRNRGNHEWIGGPSRAVNEVWPIRPTPGVNRGYVDGTLGENGALLDLTAAGGGSVYRGTALAPNDYGNIFWPEPAGNLVAMSTLQDTGSGIFLKKAYERADFLTSTEERFRPVFTATGPDGAFYVLDLYHGIIQDAVFLTNYLKDWVDQHDLGETYGENGRIYRISHEDGTPSEIINVAEASTEELVQLLTHDNGWYRDHAQRLIVVQQKTETVPGLIELFNESDNAIARLHAIWTLDGLNAAEPDFILAALNDGDRDIRAAALRVSERYLAEGHAELTEAVRGMIGWTGNDWQVQYQLAATVGEMDDANRLDAIQDIISVYGHDFIALDAALSGVHDDEVVDLFNALIANETGSAGISNAITTVASGITRVGTAEDIATMLDAISGDDRPVWQREAVLLGMEVVLAGTRDPGLAPALPPGRGGSWSVGTLGDRAFAEFNASVTALDREQNALYAEQRAANAPARPTSALGDVDGVPMVSLEAAPESFLALGEEGDLAGRVAGVAVFMTWPGKDG